MEKVKEISEKKNITVQVKSIWETCLRDLLIIPNNVFV